MILFKIECNKINKNAIKQLLRISGPSKLRKARLSHESPNLKTGRNIKIGIFIHDLGLP